MRISVVVLTFVSIAFAPALASASTVVKLLDRSAAVHSDEVVVDSTNYYGSGNDDAFGEFGLATFTFSAAEFGGPTVTGITELQYTLTHNDRNFSDGNRYGLFLTTDDFDESYGGLVYDNSGASNPGGVDTSQFSNYSSLGDFEYTPQDGGTKKQHILNLTSQQETELLSQINSGSQFSIGIAALDLDADVTFTGFDDRFETGGQPQLSITASAVPEPSSLFAVLALGSVVAYRHRRKLFA